ncbi:hypothetical protein E2320_006413 [Naja naja]|nr:hypothetical protein E2320_006413 [Naja naja]
MGTVWVTPSPLSMTMPVVQRQGGLDSYVHRRDLEVLKHDLSHPLPILEGIQRGFGQQHGPLTGLEPQLAVINVPPDPFHVIPGGHNAVIDGIIQG